ncbi:MAG: zinc metalloprotease HtpX [Candidatus Wildermuthbacteria bacterium RIFCSPLOWO2_02_FULL_47_9c]|uniref:Protease HtpX homolog n=1 Tax=Candidatus Wildermuthbacteria bacterium RIFCSPLOWO2_02_FULL_47_9c TaxID=1802466 RepID=A0A1G2RWL9_9BACT|nr:MAG: zinc metalloprotease HtpX [Candidatus Wildermuthbacteria bacterium GWA1_49_26]OHA69307.1 MAG: zinc metalloprotease HtpX [Candidatus Wildermuthbacteria bacterium RIFCSPHIGHO2_02_FULL_49_17]OHA72381.1 MAG: zinc metalloprotease HtpX [Candidatus Wildermuthbacteria bacterium RIFCSPHIGHO2_12_FULL_49_13]OHA74517.1 MAG: zinc metalloprotease HtpX [Candidatus Wildermuthbacteria bacterium RIFCSPLOWO2_01_FULL_50_46]OHA76886.1 MAG: zinc metalloprotease HtpX [Candidatus Wildermuthbacteria bacterium R
MANLYSHAESNIRKTWVYLAIFLLFIIGLGWVVSYIANAPAILWIAAIVSILMSIGSYWYSDKIVLGMTGAKPIEKRDNPELYRIVENLCITAGLPVPRIYILQDPQPNAFATGRDPQHAVVAVTTGLLSRLERTELEGVIAHELSHIGNRDILISTIVVVLTGVVVLAVDFFFRLSFRGGFRSRNDRGSGQTQVVIMLLGLVFLILAPILAQLMQFAISRKREFLADASGALLTRYPEGLARALEKISADPNQLRRASDATAHLYIASPFRGKEKTSWIHKLFMTHPPVEERVSVLRGMNI